MSTDKKKTSEIKLELSLDDSVAQGVYANMAVVNHTGGEFCFDMIFVQPQQPKATVRSRVITSPKSAKMMLHALNEAVLHYESDYGEIVVEPMEAAAEPPEGVH